MQVRGGALAKGWGQLEAGDGVAEAKEPMTRGTHFRF